MAAFVLVVVGGRGEAFRRERDGPGGMCQEEERRENQPSGWEEQARKQMEKCRSEEREGSRRSSQKPGAGCPQCSREARAGPGAAAALPGRVCPPWPVRPHAPALKGKGLGGQEPDLLKRLERKESERGHFGVTPCTTPACPT